MIVLDLYFAVRPVIFILKWVVDDSGKSLITILTRIKIKVVGYQPWGSKRGCYGSPREYGARLNLTGLSRKMLTP